MDIQDCVPLGWMGLSFTRKATPISMQDSDISEENLRLPHASAESALSFSPTNILFPQLQINISPFPFWDRQLAAKQICSLTGKEKKNHGLVYGVHSEGLVGSTAHSEGCPEAPSPLLFAEEGW